MKHFLNCCVYKGATSYTNVLSHFVLGSLRTSATLDLETKGHYWLTVCAQDQAVVPLHSCVEVSVVKIFI